MSFELNEQMVDSPQNNIAGGDGRIRLPTRDPLVGQSRFFQTLSNLFAYGGSRR